MGQLEDVIPYCETFRMIFLSAEEALLSLSVFLIFREREKQWPSYLL
jgi:hypothetical protein